MIREVVRRVSIPVHVMVPHSQSFVYDEYDLQTMKEDIAFIKASGAAGIVVGTLTGDGKVDTAALEYLLQDAEGLNVTFHRAFDEIEDQLSAFQVIAGYPQINRILTSGVSAAGAEVRAANQAARRGVPRNGNRDSRRIRAFRAGAAGVHRGNGRSGGAFRIGLRRDGDHLKPVEPSRVQAAKDILRGFE